MTNPLRRVGRTIRARFHPLFHARQSSLGRLAMRMIDRPVWLSMPGFRCPVRGLLVTHGLAYSVVGSQEVNPEALVRACVCDLGIQTFWDIGANFGYYSWLVKSLRPNAEIVLIEPLPSNAQLIRATLDKNEFSNDLLLVAAASDHSGRGVLKADLLGGATSTMEQQTETFEDRHMGIAAHELSVLLVSIDEIRSTRSAIDMMKIDVEGHEATVLRGATATLERDQPVILIECGHPNRACLQILTRAGYRLIDADRLTASPATESQNFLCLPPRHADSVDAILQSAQAYLS